MSLLWGFLARKSLRKHRFLKIKSFFGDTPSACCGVIHWITLNILIMGFAKFVVKYAVNGNEPLLVLRLQYIGSFTVIALLCLITKKTIFIGWKRILGTLIIGIFISTAMASLYTALSLSSATQVFSITTVCMVVVMTLMGAIFFKEKITKRLILPFVLGILAIYLLK